MKDKFIVADLVSEAKESGVELWVEGGQLRFRAQQDKFPETLKQQIANQKEAVIEFLQNTSTDLKRIKIGQQDSYEASAVQERLWFMEKIATEVKHYNIPVFFRVSGVLDVEKFKHALTLLVERHEMLRTSFKEVEGKLRQVIENRLDLEQIFSFSAVSNKTQLESMKAQFKDSLINYDFDLTQAPLFRVGLLRFGVDEHLLGLCFHHIIADDSAIELFMRELSVFYHADGESRELEKESVSVVRYVDYAIWQKRYLADNSQRLLAYWKNHIDTSEQVLDFPFDYTRNPSPSYAGDRLTCSHELKQKQLQTLISKVPGSTTFTVLLAAYMAFLYRYTGQSVITVGIPFTNRSHAALENTFGMFANSLPIQVKFDEGLTFIALLEQVRNRVVEAYQHGELPFEKIVDALSIQRHAAHNPLFQTMFFTNGHAAALTEWSDCQFSPERAKTQAAKFDFSVSYTVSENKLDYEFEYSTDLLKAETTERVAQHLMNLTINALQNSNTLISQLKLLDQSERDWAIYELNDNARPFNDSIRVIELFEEAVEQHRDAVAVTYRDSQITYGELNAKANQVAHFLKEKGVGPEKNVVVFMERSIDVAVALLAVMKAGGVFIPLDIEYPQARIEHILEDSQANIVVTQNQYLEKLDFVQQEKVLVEVGQFRQFEAYSSDSLPHETAMQNLSYIIYTSGSTGKPKGVMIEQLGFAHYIMWAIEHYDCHKGSGCPVHSSLGFDLTITTIFAPLCSGKTVFMLPEELGVEGLLNALTERQDYSIIKITPAHLKLFQELLPQETLQKLFGTVIIGGEALYADDLAFWREHSPNMRFINEYGATETSVADTIYEVGKELPNTTSIPVGKAIPNSSMFVLDKHFVPQPIGVIGEIYLGGNQIGRGYLNRPELNATRFLPTPFPELIGDKIYKTGDLGRLLPDGNVVFVGRIDSQVKVNGYRIELGEIDVCLEEMDAINQAICQIRHSERHGKYIVAYVLPQTGYEGLDIEEIKKSLKLQLPEYMVPKFFVEIAELPLTINGKVDAKALPDPEASNMATTETIVVKPRNQAESILCEVWRDLFFLQDAVSTQANFFQLGGDSITSLQMIFEAKKRGLFIKPKDVFHYQTIEELAAASEFKSEDLDVSYSKEVLPLTPIQHWFFDQMLCNRDHWNQAFVLDSKSHIEKMQLERALLKLAAHHDALRLKFCQQNGSWTQQYLEQITDQAMVTEMSLTSATKQQVEAAVEYAHTSLNLEKGRLFHAVILRDHKVTKILLVIHHLVVDGVSWRVLAEDLGALIKDANAMLPAKTSSFGSWASKLQEYASMVRDETVAYWQQHASLQVKWQLPFNPTVNSEESAVTTTEKLSKEETSNLFEQLRAQEIKPQEILLVSLIELLKPYATDESMLIDLEGHGREDLFNKLDLSRTVGWFTSTFPFALKVELNDLRDMLLSIRSSLASVPNKGVSYGVLRYLHPEEVIRDSLITHPEVCFNYLGDFGSKTNSDREIALTFDPAGQCVAGKNIRPYQLNINCYVINEALNFNFIGNFEQHDIGVLTAKFAQLLRQVAKKLAQQAPIKPILKLAETVKPEDTVKLYEQYGEAIVDAYPLTPMQEGMLYHTLYEPEKNEYICQMCWQLEGEVTQSEIERTWQRLAARNEVLRSVFCWENTDDLYQVVLDKPHAAVSSHFCADEAAVQAFLQEDFCVPFELQKEPAFRVALIHCNNKSHMVWTFHHILLDGWSVAKLINDFQHIYGDNTELKPSAFKFKQYVHWLKEQPNNRGLRYWSDYLRDYQAESILSKPEASNTQIANYRHEVLQVDANQSDQLVRLAKTYGVTLNVLCLSALGAALQRLHGSRDFLFGMTVSGRGALLPNIEHGIGNFLNTIPLLVRLRNTEDFSVLANTIQKDLGRHQEFEHVSLAEVQKTIKQSGATDRGLDLLYVFENYPVEKPASTDIALKNLRVREYANYPLTFIVGNSTKGLEIKLAYDINQVDAKHVQAYLATFRAVLDDLVGGDFVLGVTQVVDFPGRGLEVEKQQNNASSKVCVLNQDITKKVVNLCADVLGESGKIVLSDSFSSLGGTSLSAIRMVSKLRQAFLVDLSLKEFVACKDLAALSGLLQEKCGDNTDEDEFEEMVI